MVYQVPASKASIKQNKFEFKVGSKTLALPKMQYLTLDQMSYIEAIDETAKLAQIKEAFCAIDETVGKVIGGLDQEQVMGVFSAWQEASSVTPGESEAS